MPKCFTLKFTQENTMGADSLFTRINSWESKWLLCRKILALISLLGTHLTEHLGSWWAVELCHSPPRKQPVHTASFLERFSLSCLCIFSLGHCRVIRWVGICQLGSIGTQCAHPGKARMFHTQTHQGNHCGYGFFLQNSQFLVQSSDISEINTVLQSPYYDLIESQHLGL